MSEEIRSGPRLTALIVSRNCAAHLQRTLDALQAGSTAADLETIVIDNGSDDGSADVAAGRANVTVLRLPKNFGATKALNIGIRTAKSDMILFLSPGSELAADALGLMADRLESDAEAAAVYAATSVSYRLPDVAALSHACRTGQLPNPIPVQGDAVPVDYAPGAPMLVWRRFLKGMNYLDERFGENWWDLELCWQIRNSGKKILVLRAAGVRSEGCAAANEAIDNVDRVTGASAYIGKHFGFGASVGFRVGTALGAAGQALTFRQPGHNLNRFLGILASKKIDGAQS